ncbi:zinc-binding alcohol dehydrogenase family protein [Actinomadura sp. 9N407]|uniref:zinc-binding alcohol dehydrogenase family protein n=1 Tax=Actinomadura sp. 9N407 TaxID=3375154 RepID=UPI003791BCC6
MRAARIHGWGTPPVVEEVPDPVRRAGETLVRIEAATVSHLDVTVATGEFTLKPPLPYVPGVEGSGIVLESDTLKPGTQVIFRDRAHGLTGDGSWREFASVRDGALVSLGFRLEAAIAATFFVPVTTAYVALHDVGRIEAGQTVMVSGATGAVGSVAVQLAQAAGAEVIALVSRASRLDQLPMGVTGVALDDAAARARLATERPAHLMIDTVGGAGLGDRIRWMRSGGKVACLGYTAGTAFSIDLPSWFYTDVAILPVNLLSREQRAQEVARKLLPDIAAGAISVPVEEYALTEIADVLEKLGSRGVNGRAVVLM